MSRPVCGLYRLLAELALDLPPSFDISPLRADRPAVQRDAPGGLGTKRDASLSQGEGNQDVPIARRVPQAKL